jgi:hypothetical protein
MTTAPTPAACSETPPREALAGTPCSGSFFWERYEYTKDKRQWNNRRLARARQAVEKEADAMALCPELRRFDTVEDRVAMMDDREIRITIQMRNARAAMWREVRAMIRALDTGQRERLKAKWNTRFMPGTPAHLFACAKLIGVYTHNPFLSQNVRGEARRAGLRIQTEGLSPSPPPTCSVLAGGVRVHRASPNDANLRKTARPGKRKIRDARKIIAALSPGGRVLPAASRQGSCPTHRHRSRRRHLADHGPAPTGSNRTLSRLAITQARTESPALAHRGWHGRNQIESSPWCHQSTPPTGHPKQLFNL